LSEFTDDDIDAYYYLGDEKIGCMDKNASNYLETAVLDSESCIYLTGFGSAQIDNTIKIYPQPASGFIYMELVGDKLANHNAFTIYNILGEKIYIGKAAKYENLKINTSAWMPGIYYAVIKVENKNITHRFVIE
jgi:hypothetical protein